MSYVFCSLQLMAMHPSLCLYPSSKPLTGTNYEDWYKSLTINLAIMYLALAFRVDAPAKLTDKSTAVEVSHHEQWEHSNKIFLMIMKYTIFASLLGNAQLMQLLLKSILMLLA